MAEPELLLDSNIRLWVVLPIVFITFLVGVIRHYVSILLQSDKKLTLEQVSDRCVKSALCYILLSICSQSSYLISFPVRFWFGAESSEKMENTSLNRYVLYILSEFGRLLFLINQTDNFGKYVFALVFPDEEVLLQ